MIEKLKTETGYSFPEKVTAFREGMAVHGRYGQPCPVCSSPVQRIRYASNETNYCPRCQTHGRLLADRSLSRLLKKDWPKSIDELERVEALRVQPWVRTIKTIYVRIHVEGAAETATICGAAVRGREELVAVAS